MRAPFQHVTFWPLRLMLVMGLVLASSGSVLCLGSGGHVKIESICQPCCGDDGAVCKVAETETDHDHRGACSDCTDVPLVLSLRSSRLTDHTLDHQAAHLDLPLPMPVAGDHSANVATHSVLPDTPVRPNMSHHQRSTVLRC